MDTIILQIPLNKVLRDRAKKVAEDQGFSSLQEAIRIFLNKLAHKDIEFGFHSVIELSAQNEVRYNRMLHQVQTKKVKTKVFSDTETLMKHLER